MPIYRFPITGIRHHAFKGRLDELYECAPGKRVTMSIEPENEAEPDAVICLLGCEHLGYVRSGNDHDAALKLLETSGKRSIIGKVVEVDRDNRVVWVEADAPAPTDDTRPRHKGNLLETWKYDGPLLPDPTELTLLHSVADTPTLFAQITQPLDQPFIIVPRHSSENRRYIPLAFMGQDVVASDSTLIIPSATLYHFGVLTSNVHMAWMRAVCGRLKSDYRYSKDIVYNNFPWPSPSEEQRAKIEQTAQAILDARALYPTSSLADLYDEVAMPPELRQAHQQNDRAVMQAYGFKPGPLFAESDCVAALFRLYQALITKL